MLSISAPQYDDLSWGERLAVLGAVGSAVWVQMVVGANEVHNYIGAVCVRAYTVRQCVCARSSSFFKCVQCDKSQRFMFGKAGKPVCRIIFKFLSWKKSVRCYNSTRQNIFFFPWWNFFLSLKFLLFGSFSHRRKHVSKKVFFTLMLSFPNFIFMLPICF